MALALLFLDSWDHYSVITDKWNSAGTDCSIRLNTGQARTGIGCLQINSAAFGPIHTLTTASRLTVGTAYYSNSLTTQDCINFGNPSGGLPVRVGVLGNGSIIVRQGTGAPVTLGTSAANVFHFNAYNYVAVQVRFANSPNGLVVVQVNGQEVLRITGISTNIALDLPDCSAVQLMAAGGIPTCFHDDTYIADWTASAGAPFYNGAPRLYATVPTADGSPTNWTPSTGTDHFALVDEIPPNGDTDYVSSGTVGQVDQYVYDPLAGGVPAASTIPAAQYVLDMKIVAAGARSVGACVGGVVSSGNALTTNYLMYTTPFDVNPVTGVPFVLADFPGTQFGPQVTL